MQASELWRPGVVLPLTDVSVTAIEEGRLEQADVRSLPLGDEWNLLFSAGPIPEINRECAVVIGEHESEWLPAEQAGAALRIVRADLQRKGAGRLRDALLGLEQLLEEAVELKKPVLFVF